MGSLALKNWFSTVALLLLAMLTQAYVSWPIRADRVFWRWGGGLKRQELKQHFRQRGNTELQHWRLVCLLTIKACKNIEAVTQNKIMNLKMSRICVLWRISKSLRSIWRGHECVSNSRQDIWCNTRNVTLWWPKYGNLLVQTDFPVSWVCDIWYVAGLSGHSHTYVNTVTVTCWCWMWAERDVRGQCWLSMCDQADEMISPMFYSSYWL